MRTALVLLIGLALGFSAAYLVFERPLGGDSPRAAEGMSVGDVESKLLESLRFDDPDIDSASCAPRDGSNGRQFICSADGPDPYVHLFDYLVTVHGSTIDYRRRPIS